MTGDLNPIHNDNDNDNSTGNRNDEADEAVVDDGSTGPPGDFKDDLGDAGAVAQGQKPASVLSRRHELRRNCTCSTV